MSDKKPDQVVYSETQGYDAHLKTYATNLGAPVIRTDDVVAWKQRGINNVNKEFEHKFNVLKQQYENLMQEFEWNELIYNAKFSFEPILGEIYHLYRDEKGFNFLSLISPLEWNKEHLGTFQLNSDKKWVALH